MKNFSILMLALAFCLVTHEANAQDKMMPKPRILDDKTWTWEGSKDNYAKYSDLVFEVGMGNERNGVGCGDAGVEIENVRKVRLSVDASPVLARLDANAFAGFMVDYSTAEGYTKRVALSIGVHSDKRTTKTPIWGKVTTPDQFVDLGRKKEYDLDLKEWAPDGWNGKVWFTVTLQNTGQNTSLKAILLLPSDEDTLLAAKVIGRFDMSCAEIPKLDSHWLFTKDGRAIQDGNDMGAWSVAGGKTIITFTDKQFGQAVLSFKNEDTLVGKNEHRNGSVFNWVLKREKTEVAQKAKEEASKTKDDKTLLQGRWYAVAEETEGKALSKDDIATLNKILDVSSDEFRMERTSGGKRGSYVGTIRLGQGDGQKLFDFEGKGPGGSQIELHGIYEMTEDVFKVCFATNLAGKGYTRPREFRSSPGRVFVTFKRSAEKVEVAQKPKEETGKKEDKGANPPKNFTNGIGMKFVWIPPGTFLMGSPKEEKEREDNETQHKVTLTKGFYMGVYTVTQEEWQEVMGNNFSKFKGEKNLPVEQVSWNDCQEFVKKLREKDKKLYRLPTEAEWEFACRAGTKTPFHFGETISTEQANYYGEAVYGDGKKGEYRMKTTPVGSFPANAWGLHDMHGNVGQWCQDIYGDYPQKDVVDPTGAEKGSQRSLRGGCWFGPPKFFRSAFRYGFEPGIRYDYFGFRLCFSVEEKIEVAQKPREEPGKKQEKENKTLSEITADFFPHIPGTVYLYDTDYYPIKGLPAAWKDKRVRTRCTLKDGGVIEAVVFKEGTRTNGKVDWTKEVNRKSTAFDALYRRNAEYIETGIPWNDTKTQFLWFPTIKIGAKEGESWQWRHPFLKETRKYVVTDFDTYKGRPSVEIVVESTQQLGNIVINYVHRKTYAKGIGLVASTTEWNFPDDDRGGKPKWELTVATRIVEDEKELASEKAEREATAKREAEVGKKNRYKTPIQILKHEDAVLSVAFSSDGKSVVTASWGGIVRVLNIGDGKELQRWKLPNDFATPLAVSSDGQLLAALSKKESVIRVWTRKTGDKLIDVAYKEKPPEHLTFSNDGTLLAIAYGQNLTLVSTSTAKEVTRISLGKGQERLSSVVISQDNAIVATAAIEGFGLSKIHVKSWRVATGEPMLSLTYMAGGTVRMAFSPSGEMIAVASYGSGVRVFHASTGKELQSQELEKIKGNLNTISSLAFSPDGKRLFTGANDRVVGWNTQTWQKEYVVNLHRGSIDSVAFSPNGVEFATASFDKTVLLLRLRKDDEQIVEEKAIKSEELKKQTLAEIKSALGEPNEIHQTSSPTAKLYTWKRDAGYVVLLVFDNGNQSFVQEGFVERTWADVERMKRAVNK